MAETKTTLADLVNPQVLGDWVTDHLQQSMRLAPLCTVDTSLQGRAGDTILVPRYTYIGDAAVVAEGEAVPVATMTASTQEVQIKKAGNGIRLTDESVLCGYGDPVGEAVSQLTLSIAGKVDSDVLAALGGVDTDMTYTTTGQLSADVIADALVKFGERDGGDKVLFVAPAQLAQLRKSESWLKSTDLGAEMLVSGVVGSIHGCQVVVSDRIVEATGSYKNYIVMPGAVSIYLKKDTTVETDRDILCKTTLITADKHYAVALTNEARAVCISCTTGAGA